MALTRDELGTTACSVYEGELNKHWTIGPKVHGGAMVALCANAARTAARADPVEPVAVSASFLSAPDPGPMRLVTSMRKRGRRVSLVDVELIQGDRAAVHAVVTLGEPEHLVPPLLSANPAVRPDGPRAARRCGADRPRPPAGRAGAPGRGLRRPAALISTLGVSTDGRPPVIQILGAAARRGTRCAVRADVRRRVGAGDVRREPHRLGADRAAHRLPAGAAGRRLAAGGVHVRCRSVRTGSTRTTPSSTRAGRIIVQSRQLAMVPRALDDKTRRRLQCWAAWPESRSSVAEVWAKPCCRACCGPGGRSRIWWSPSGCPTAPATSPKRTACW